MNTEVPKGFTLPAYVLFSFDEKYESFSKQNIRISLDTDKPFGLPDCLQSDEVDCKNHVDYVLKNLSKTSEDFSQELLPFVPQLLHKVQDNASKNGAILFNGRVVRLEHWSLKKDGPMPLLMLQFRPTNWFTFAVTNFSLKEKVGDHTVDSLLNEEPKKLLGAKRANNMAVSINVIVEQGNERYVIISQRSKKNANYPGVWGHTAGGDMDPEADLDNNNEIDPIKAVVRELKEETGYEIEENRVQVLALILKADQLQPILITQVVTEEPLSHIIGRQNTINAADAWEVSGKFKTLSFTPEHIAEFFALTPKEDLAPTLLTDLYFSLIYFYGKSQVEKAFDSWGGIKPFSA